MAWLGQSGGGGGESDCMYFERRTERSGWLLVMEGKEKRSQGFVPEGQEG